MHKYINPVPNKQVEINSNLGKNVLKNYINQIQVKTIKNDICIDKSKNNTILASKLIEYAKKYNTRVKDTLNFNYKCIKEDHRDMDATNITKNKLIEKEKLENKKIIDEYYKSQKLKNLKIIDEYYKLQKLDS